MVAGGRELIDTLWNVNDDDMYSGKCDLRINRYIMECKYASEVRMYSYVLSELIDTLWNVNIDTKSSITFSERN